AREHERVRRDDASLAVPLDEAAGVEVLGVHYGVEGVHEDAPFRCGAQVVTEAREPVTDDALAHEALLEGRDHALLGAGADPTVRPDAHRGTLPAWRSRSRLRRGRPRTTARVIAK